MVLVSVLVAVHACSVSSHLGDERGDDLAGRRGVGLDLAPVRHQLGGGRLCDSAPVMTAILRSGTPAARSRATSLAAATWSGA